MKYILQIPAHLYIGGVEKVARDIGIYADQRDYQIHYIVFDKEIGNYEEELIAHGSKVFHLQEPSLDYRKFLNNIRQIMSETHYDVVHAHTMFNSGWFMLVARLMKVPIRITHAHSALDIESSFKVRIYESLMRQFILINATDFIACGEKAGIRLFGEKTYRQKGNLILNGIDVMRFRFNLDNRIKIKEMLGLETNFVIGHVGHLLDVKNQKYLIELMPEILKKKPDAVLLLLGDGPDRQMLETTVQELKLQDHVIMTGNVPNVNEYLSAMDVFAFPSLYEGMPLSIIEVQANGLPCILSTGVPEDVYLTDLLLPLELSEPASWVDAICSARRDNSQKYASILKASGFDTESVMQKIYDVYKRNI